MAKETLSQAKPGQNEDSIALNLLLSLHLTLYTRTEKKSHLLLG